MNKHLDIEKRVNGALESLDGIRRAEPRPFFYTRLKARLENEGKNVWENLGSFLARPAVALAGLVLVLGLNAFVLIQKDNTSSTAMGEELVQEEENILTASNSFDYENLEP
jgi:hypothetical protein